MALTYPRLQILASLAFTFGMFIISPSSAKKVTDLPKAGTAQPQSCGNQDSEDRPNACAVLVDGTWVLNRSQCMPLSNGDFLYTHCNGSTRVEHKEAASEGTHLCCLHDNSCPGSAYVGECLDSAP